MARSSERFRRRHRQTVVNCYDCIDQFLPPCGFEDLTEGIYHGDATTSFDQAQQNQVEYLLDEAHCGRGSRVLDIGCGYGRLLENVRARGGNGVGITLSTPQIERCREKGLEVRLLDYRNISDAWRGKFDAIIANGSMEHFVHPGDAAAGHASAIYRDFFHRCHQLLDPSTCGRVVSTVVHFGPVQICPTETLRHPLFHRWKSSGFHCALLARTFGGYYPSKHQLQQCAEPIFTLRAEQDGTLDYRFTSDKGLKEVRRMAYSRSQPWALWSKLLRFLLRHPVHALNMYCCVMVAESWNWQFRGDPPPMQLLRQTWDYQSVTVGGARHCECSTPMTAIAST